MELSMTGVPEFGVAMLGAEQEKRIMTKKVILAVAVLAAFAVLTDQELAENTPIGNAARKAKKAAERADKADGKIPRRKKPKVALRFDDEVKRPQEVKAPREKARGRKKTQAEQGAEKATDIAAKTISVRINPPKQRIILLARQPFANIRFAAALPDRTAPSIVAGHPVATQSPARNTFFNSVAACGLCASQAKVANVARRSI